MLVIFIGIALGLGLVLTRLGLPAMVGFLLAGFAARAAGFQAPEGLDFVADLGVTLLLFSIGLKLDLRRLVKPEVWGGATVQMALTTGLMAAILYLAGKVFPTDIFTMGPTALWTLAFALSFSSTVFAVKVLEEKGDFSALYGAMAIGILIVQDLFAVAFLSASAGKVPGPEALLVLLLPLLRPLLYRLLDYCGHGELFVLCGLFMALGLGAEGFKLVGLKPDLGALAVGAVLAGYHRSYELASSLFGLKELLLLGFFLSIGLQGIPTLEMGLVALGLCLILPLKTVLFHFLVGRFGFRARTSFFTALSLTNYSEFGLIVAALAAKEGLISPEWPLTMALTVSASFALSSPLSLRSEPLYLPIRDWLKRYDRKKPHALEAPIGLSNVRVVVFGMGRIGQGVYDEMARAFAGQVLGVEHDPKRMEELKASGRLVILGDALDTDFWRRLEKRPELELIVLAMPWHQGNIRAAKLLRSMEYTCPVTAVARHADEVEELEANGVRGAFNMYDQAGQGLAHTAMETLDPEVFQRSRPAYEALGERRRPTRCRVCGHADPFEEAAARKG